MPKTTAEPTSDQLAAEAERIAARLTEIREQEAQRQQQQAQRRADAERQFDEELVAGYDRKALDAEVDAARATFDAAVADLPIVKALADYTAAQQLRRTRVYEHLSALSRLGHDVDYRALPTVDVAPVQDVVTAAVARIVGDRTATEVNDLHARRAAAGDTAAEETNR
ncbi:hypothetical protein [Geodermatophilus chilensis]|uniref:hypothetical protein n=1 Tax=Geodermatophilus chilensis TaxID=2035835 RepID=UPI000C269F1B|nr:hypothetical protein [Geodermatophilus chilensis]